MATPTTMKPKPKRPTSFVASSSAGHSGGDRNSNHHDGSMMDDILFDKASTISGLTSAEFSNSNIQQQQQQQHSGSNSILPRSSLQQRIIDRTNEFSLSKLKFDQLPLMGRDKQLKQVSDVIKTVIGRQQQQQQQQQHDSNNVLPTPPSRGLILIHGESGTGKTSLITDGAIRKQVRRLGGLFTLGKAELQQSGEPPLASIQEALNLLSYNIVQLPKEQDQRNKLQTTSAYSIKSSMESTISSKASAVSSDSSSVATIATLEQVQDKLLEELDTSEWELLVDAVPGLEKIMMGTDKHNELVATTENTTATASSGASFKETSDRLKYVYRHFLRVVSSVCPLVLVLDDCQWADTASLDWIKGLVSDTTTSSSGTTTTTSSQADTKAGSNKNRHGNGDTSNGGDMEQEPPKSWDNEDANENSTIDNDNGSIVVVATYRTNEVGEDHALTKMVKDLHEMLPSSDERKDEAGNLFLMNELVVPPLSVDQVNNVLMELLCREPHETMELAKIVHQKTQGNPFFMVQLLMQMKDDGHLTFNFGLMKWGWDIAAIVRTCSATENVANLMRSKLSQHEIAVQVLPVAGALGGAFSFSLLERIMAGLHSRQEIDTTELNLTQAMKDCVEAGFLDTTSDGDYKFVHDMIQESAMELLEEKTKLSIGSIFMEQFENGVDLGDTIYSAVKFANMQGVVGDDEEKQFVLAKMNAVAGERAIQRAAFDVAAGHLNDAIQLLPQDHWKRDDSSLRLYTLAGAAAFCNGNHDRVKVFTDEVLENSSAPLLDKMDLIWTFMETAEVAVDSTPGFDLALKVLKDPIFKIRFPTSNLGVAASTFSSLIKAKLKKNKLSPRALQSMPIKTDRKSLALMRTLDKLSSVSFHVRPDIFPLVVLKIAEYTETNGLNPYSSLSWAMVGLLFVVALDDLETAKLCGEASLTILRRCPMPAIQARAISYVLHWTMPIKSCLKPLLKGYEVGMRNGNIDAAFWDIYFFLELSIWSGGTLAPIYADFLTYIRQATDYDAQKNVAAMKITAYMIARLRGTADEFDELPFQQLCKVKGGETLQCVLARTQIYVACVLGDHEKAAEMSLEWHAKIMKLLPAQTNTLEVTFVSALSCFAVARKTKDRKYAKHAKACMQKIKGWVSKGCPNCVAHEALVEAEYYAWKKNRGTALQRYEAAALLAGRRGLRHIQAMANERSALYANELGDNHNSEYHWKQALTLYDEWGASQKVDFLRGHLFSADGTFVG